MKQITILTALLTTFLAYGSATTITILPADNIAGAIADRDDWLTANFGIGTTAQTLETFENDARGPWTSLASDVGTFNVMQGGLTSLGQGTQKNNFTILSDSDSPFSGRYNTTPGGKNWLDSNDITKLHLTTTLNTIYFFITDANDHNGGLQIQTADGSVVSFPTRTGDGSIFFVGITSSDPIGSVDWLNTARADGFGLDDFGTAAISYSGTPVPEPATGKVVFSTLLILAAVVEIRERKLEKQRSIIRLESTQRDQSR